MDEGKAVAGRSVTPLRPHDRIPPHSDEAEISVLGGMLIEETAADYAMEKLVDDDFYHPSHRLIFEAVQRLRDQGHAPDALAVREELQRHGNLEKAGGSEYLARIVEIVPTAANIAYHAKIVLDNSVKRRLITVGTRVVGETYDSTEDSDVLLNRAEEEIFRLGERRHKKSFTPINQLLHGA
ncbi:MAG: replicative DNA helicase, partial [Gemmatimonadota bacterium]